VNTERLLKLADFLETIPDKSFNIRQWVTRQADKPEGDVPGECGFAGCAMGWAAHARLFDGLTIANDGIIYGGRYPGMYAPVHLFGLSLGHARWMFDGPGYDNNPTPADVAHRIRAFIASNGKFP
jgi:hypothetical protein